MGTLGVLLRSATARNVSTTNPPASLITVFTYLIPAILSTAELRNNEQDIMRLFFTPGQTWQKNQPLIRMKNFNASCILRQQIPITAEVPARHPAYHGCDSSRREWKLTCSPHLNYGIDGTDLSRQPKESLLTGFLYLDPYGATEGNGSPGFSSTLKIRAPLFCDQLYGSLLVH